MAEIKSFNALRYRAEKAGAQGQDRGSSGRILSDRLGKSDKIICIPALHSCKRSQDRRRVWKRNERYGWKYNAFHTCVPEISEIIIQMLSTGC